MTAHSTLTVTIKIMSQEMWNIWIWRISRRKPDFCIQFLYEVGVEIINFCVITLTFVNVLKRKKTKKSTFCLSLDFLSLISCARRNFCLYCVVQKSQYIRHLYWCCLKYSVSVTGRMLPKTCILGKKWNGINVACDTQIYVSYYDVLLCPLGVWNDAPEAVLFWGWLDMKIELSILLLMPVEICIWLLWYVTVTEFMGRLQRDSLRAD